MGHNERRPHLTEAARALADARADLTAALRPERSWR
ncbi:hypothetical protein JOF35_008852 [Streptomyces demainii]|uniref:Uncharacterized protein n=1 Tax=Streptomyces demainii TaxID=588122 RepID=A0ABT9L6Z8_9ACTN|nr:hypothetical protein [Streptomyces demainii]